MFTITIPKKFGWLIAGLFIGILAASFARSVNAQPQDPGRLRFTIATNNSGASTVFILDTRSKACWLAIGTASGVFSGVAQAPDAACR